jgi:hypothetical protein
MVNRRGWIAILLIIALECAAGLSAVIAKAATRDSMSFGYILLLMIGLAMYFGRLIANWASGP